MKLKARIVHWQGDNNFIYVQILVFILKEE